MRAVASWSASAMVTSNTIQAHQDPNSGKLVRFTDSDQAA